MKIIIILEGEKPDSRKLRASLRRFTTELAKENIYGSVTLVKEEMKSDTRDTWAAWTGSLMRA